MTGEKYRFGANKYRYGFNGKEKETESFEGAYDFGARILDGRLGRWLSVDGFASKFADVSVFSYANNSVIAFVDVGGLYPKLVITEEITGYTIQSLKGNDNYFSDPAVVVPTYKVILMDVNEDGTTSEVTTFSVTRDAWYSLGINDRGEHELLNRAFEPAIAEQNIYGAEWTPDYPRLSGCDAFSLTTFGDKCNQAEPLATQTNLDGTSIDGARSDPNYSCGVALHVGGTYEVAGYDYLAGSYGCFAFIPIDDIYSTPTAAKDACLNDDYDDIVSNETWKTVADQIIGCWDSTGGMEIEVEKRANVYSNTPTEVLAE